MFNIKNKKMSKDFQPEQKPNSEPQFIGLPSATIAQNAMLYEGMGGTGAVFSDCRKYRYSLWRFWDQSKPLIMFIGLNPSTANESSDDATIRRVKSFAKQWGYGGVYMCNCFPFISTNPKDLQDNGNTAMNDFTIYNHFRFCKDIVFAWGNFAIVKETGRDIELSKMFPNAKALIKNKDGSPRHPLYVPSTVELVKW